jgi:soluble lytic murein transglycosylase
MRFIAAHFVVVLVFFATVFSGDTNSIRAQDAPLLDAGQPATAEDVFDPAIVSPSIGSNEQQVLAAMRAGDRDRAYQLATVALEHATQPIAGRLHWLAAKAASNGDEELIHLTLLGDSDHPLSRWAQLRRAELLVKTDPKEAAQISENLRDSWVGRRRARRVRALALLSMGRADDALPLFRALVQETPSNQAAATDATPLADFLATKSDAEAKQEALDLYRRIASRAPASRAGIDANAKAEKLLKGLPERIRQKISQLSVDDMFNKGAGLFNAHKYEEAASQYEAIAKRVKKSDPAQACKAHLEEGKALMYEKKRKESATLLVATAAACKDADVRAWARFYAGQAYARIADPKAAIKQYQAIWTEAPTHSLADDALYRAALAAKDTNDEPTMVSWLREIPKRYPDGDMKDEARFALVQVARHAKKWDEALEQLDLLIAEGSKENLEGMHGQAIYWRARTLNDLGRVPEAVIQYRAVIQNEPLSYYAQQAFVRLAEIDPSTAKELLLQLEDDQPSVAPTFTRRAEMNNSAFERAVELLRVDEEDLAKQELNSMGAMGAGADQNMLWLVATMFDRAGAYVESINLARRKLRSFLAMAPKGEARAMWRIAYPRAFDPLIETVGKESGVSSAFIRAVAREESGFDPNSVSAAHAYGLIQLIVPTARQHARDLGLPSDPDSLKRPEVNLRIGAAYIRSLWQRYEPNPAVVPAAYNAGEAVVDKWLRENAGQDLDAWIDAIPYPETRRYTRRVLQTYGVYAWLETGKLPPLPSKLPMRSTSP